MNRYSLELDGRRCVCCGICMDLCPARAVGMHAHAGQRTLEGALRARLPRSGPGTNAFLPGGLMTYPFLAEPSRCNGCGLCVEQCPVSALAVHEDLSEP